MKSTSSNKSGFTLVEIMIVIAIIGLLVAIAIPNFIKSRDYAQMNACIENLKQINAAAENYAVTANLGPTGTYAMSDISGADTKFLKGLVNSEIKCPSGGTYVAGDSIAVPPTCTKASIGHSL